MVRRSRHTSCGSSELESEPHVPFGRTVVGSVDLAAGTRGYATREGSVELVTVLSGTVAAVDLTPDDDRAASGTTTAPVTLSLSTGDVVITQGGKVVDPSTAKGPIRIRKV